MFNYLYDEAYILDPPLTPKICSDISNHPDKIPDYISLIPANIFMPDDFCINGRCYVSPAAPSTDHAVRNLFYIGLFFMSYSIEGFYIKEDHGSGYLLSFTYEGEGLLEYDGSVHLLRSGTGFLIDRRNIYSLKTAGVKWTHADLYLSGPYIDDYYQILRKEQNCIFSQSANGTFQKNLNELIKSYESILPFKDLVISSKIDELLSIILTSSKFFINTLNAAPEFMTDLLKYMHSSYDKKITLEQLSQMSGFSKPHLIRLFNKYIGCSPKEYIIRLRIDRSKRLLEETALPTSTICSMVGIDDSSYFCALFKKRTGYTPYQYRLSHHRQH